MKRNVISNLLIIFIIVVLLFVGLYITKYRIIIFQVKSKLKDNVMNNYSYTIIGCEFENNKTVSTFTSTYYVMDQNFYATIKNNINDTINSIISYKDANDEIILYNKNGKKYYKINGETNYSTDMMSAPSNFKQFSDIIIFQIENKIDKIVTTEKNGKACYLAITKDGGNYWIEKDTGIVISYIENNYLYNLEYSINNVKSSDIIKPDITDYLKQE